MKLDRLNDSLKELHEVLRPNVDPHNIKALYRKAKVLDLQGNFQEAIDTINCYENGPNKTAQDDKTFLALKKQIKADQLERAAT